MSQKTRYNHRDREASFLARDLLIQKGYTIIRTTGESSPLDLIAWQGRGYPLLILTRRTRANLETPGDVLRAFRRILHPLLSLERPCQARIQFWLYADPQGWRFFDVMPGGIAEVPGDVA